MPEEITTQTVITAIRAIHDRTGHWPSRQEIAAYLECREESVKEALVLLRRKRIMRDRVRGGTTRWMPWSEL